MSSAILLNTLETAAPAQPNANDMICVSADTCGKAAMRTVVTRKISTDVCLHHTLRNEGVRSPISANMKLDAPTTSADEKNHEAVARRYAATTCGRRILFLRVHSEKQFTARWNTFTWKK